MGIIERVKKLEASYRGAMSGMCQCPEKYSVSVIYPGMTEEEIAAQRAEVEAALSGSCESCGRPYNPEINVRRIEAEVVH